MGTHPIFESDFDCLTERRTLRASFKEPCSWGVFRPLVVDAAIVRGKIVMPTHVGMFFGQGCKNVSSGRFARFKYASSSLTTVSESSKWAKLENATSSKPITS